MKGVDSPAIFIGCAGWSVPKEHAQKFPTEGSHLERYAGRFLAVEINSSFYRPHRPDTYLRWATSVAKGFRFAVKVPQAITHERRLVDTTEVLERFLTEAGMLGEKLGPLLVQMPPSLAFNSTVAGKFFTTVRKLFVGALVCEPRHKSWFKPEVDKLLVEFKVARVAADPAFEAAAADPGGWDGMVYYRLHGSPQMYYSSYPAVYLQILGKKLTQAMVTAPVWCIFDNTALGAATGNALDLLEQLGISPGVLPDRVATLR